MRTRHLLAAVTIAIGTATALAAPASADAQLDQAFLKGVKDKGLTIADGDALSLAQSICDVLSHGGSVNQALSLVTKKTNWSVQQATDFGGLAVYAYCKNNIPGAK
jgi:Protein of unknown function (DUF732)